MWFGGLSLSWPVSPAAGPTFWRQTAPCIFKAQPVCVTPPKQGGRGAGCSEAFIIQSQLGDPSPTAWERGARLVQIVPIVPGPPRTMSVSLGKGNLMGRGTVWPGVLRVIKPSHFQQLFLPGFATCLGFSETKARLGLLMVPSLTALSWASSLKNKKIRRENLSC